MAVPTVAPTGRERRFDVDEIIVSKTDLKGRITYANDVFLRVAGWSEQEILGEAHNCIRHPAMPRCVFQLLWDVIEAGEEIFAYVINMAKNGDHYWVLAHVTPTFDSAGKIVSYHSNRRVPSRSAVDTIEPIYAQLLEVEAGYKNVKDAVAAGTQALMDTLGAAGVTYPEFVWSLTAEGKAA